MIEVEITRESLEAFENEHPDRARQVHTKRTHRDLKDAPRTPEGGAG